MFQMKPNVNYWRQDLSVNNLLGGLGTIEPGETIGVAGMYVGPNGRRDKRVAPAYIITDGTYFHVYGTGRLAHIVYQLLCAQVCKWAVHIHIGADAPEPDYYV